MGEGAVERLARVLVATDFSRTADFAGERAVRLPLRRGGTLVVAHVLPEGLPRELQEDAEEEAGRSLKKAICAASALADEVGNQIEFRSVVTSGRAFLEIIRLAHRERVVERHLY